jgi:hypothetical protein
VQLSNPHLDQLPRLARSPPAGHLLAVVGRGGLAIPLAKVGENAFAGWPVRAACSAVVAGVGFYLGDEVVFILGGDRFLATLAVNADGHLVSLFG